MEHMELRWDPAGPSHTMRSFMDGRLVEWAPFAGHSLFGVNFILNTLHVNSAV